APTPTPTPAASPSSTYIRFADIYAYRLGSGVTLPSACSAVAFDRQPPSVLPTNSFGQGATFRFVVTPQVWAVNGDGFQLSFDGRTVDPFATGAEAAYMTEVAGEPVRFTIVVPDAGGRAFAYSRLASVAIPVERVSRQTHCIVGISTLSSDLATAPSTPYGDGRVLATAYLADSGGGPARAYGLGNSIVAITPDPAGRRITLTLRLVGTPMAGGADIPLGSFAATASIDAATGNFTAPLTSSDRGVIGTLSGRFFGLQAIEVAAAFGATVAADGAQPAFTIAGGIFAAR
uniref:hypothetical protein n=1 Tax=Sphingomonas sp. CCH18-H6 TaxID=1768787 RepID=UPI0009EC205D